MRGTVTSQPLWRQLLRQAGHGLGYGGTLWIVRCHSYNQQRVRKQVFAPHSNIWWGVNKFCRVLNEPPNGFGGEHPRVKIFYSKHIPFAET